MVGRRSLLGHRWGSVTCVGPVCPGNLSPWFCYLSTMGNFSLGSKLSITLFILFNFRVNWQVFLKILGPKTQRKIDQHFHPWDPPVELKIWSAQSSKLYTLSLCGPKPGYSWAVSDICVPCDLIRSHTKGIEYWWDLIRLLLGDLAVAPGGGYRIWNIGVNHVSSFH